MRFSPDKRINKKHKFPENFDFASLSSLIALFDSLNQNLK